jgi:hypothetical protein
VNAPLRDLRYTANSNKTLGSRRYRRVGRGRVPRPWGSGESAAPNKRKDTDVFMSGKRDSGGEGYEVTELVYYNFPSNRAAGFREINDAVRASRSLGTLPQLKR